MQPSIFTGFRRKSQLAKDRCSSSSSLVTRLSERAEAGGQGKAEPKAKAKLELCVACVACGSCAAATAVLAFWTHFSQYAL